MNNTLLTNNSAMVALETLRGINRDLASVQAEISTGKKVANAKDNAAIWAISTVMETDIDSFKQINDSLGRGMATVGVARNAAESVTSLLQDMKELVVSAQDDLNTDDRTRIQADITAKRDQITNIVNAAQFNGVNLVQGTDNVNFLASLDRASDGTVSTSNIEVNRQDLTESVGSYGTGTSLATNITASAASVDSTGAANQLELTLAQVSSDTSAISVTINGSTVTQAYTTDEATTMSNLAAQINGLGLNGISASTTSATLELINTNSFIDYDVTYDAGGTNTIAVTNNGDTTESAGAANTQNVTKTLTQRAEAVELSTVAAVNDGDSYRVTIDGNNYEYIAGAGESMQDVARGLKTAIDAGGIADVTTNVSQDATTGAWSVDVDYGGTGTISLADTGQAGGVASGGLFGLGNIDVTTATNAAAALNNVETLLNNSIASAASFGSAQGRLESQAEFVTQITDALTSGVGTLVDADLEAASARLQALQVQQQLGTQALSIANQSPQSLLSLFQ